MRRTRGHRVQNGITQLHVISQRRHGSHGERRRYKSVRGDDAAGLVLLHIGQAAQKVKKVLEAIGTKNAPALIWEMAKLAGSKRMRASYDWERALSVEKNRKK